MACTQVTPTFDYAATVSPRQPLLIEDLSVPSIVRKLESPRESFAVNRGLLSVSESLKQRVKLRLDFETNVSWHGQRSYKRLRHVSVLVSAPSPEQAELFIQAIHDFAATLNGKWLAPKP